MRTDEQGTGRVTGPLDGITVVSMEHAVSAPYATRQLADLGARVLKIERPDGGDFARSYDTLADGLASYFVWVNRGKESVALDVKRPAALAALHRLVDGADVFVQNLGPGAAGRLGLDAATLRARNPRLVVCDINGYGTEGPYARKRAYDLLVQCEAGLAGATGRAGAPAKAGLAVADLASAMHAFGGILAALLARERTGEGAALSVAMFDAIAEWMTYSTIYSRSTGTAHEPIGLGHPTLVPYDAYATVDGTLVVVGVQNDREWKRLAGALGLAEAGADPRFDTTLGRHRHRDEVDAAVGAAMARLSAEAAEALLEEAGVGTARVRTSLELLDHPQLVARDRWRDTPTSAGAIPVLLPPVTLDDREVVFGAVPELGQHTDAVLRELGLSPAERAEAVGP